MSDPLAPRPRKPPANTTKPKARVPSYVKRRKDASTVITMPAQTAALLWRVAHAARGTTWAPEMDDGGSTAYGILDDALDALDAHIRIGGAVGGAL